MSRSPKPTRRSRRAPLNFRKGQQNSPEYLKLNPKHKVPLLLVDGVPLTESTAIQMWIARTFPQAKLLPTDPWQELKAISVMSWCSSGIHPFLARINNPPRVVCDLPGAEASVVKAATEMLHENYKIADDMLKGREFFFDHFTAARRAFLLVHPARHAARRRRLRLSELRGAFRAHQGAAERAEAAGLREIGERGVRQGGVGPAEPNFARINTSRARAFAETGSRRARWRGR